jgi:hypothetical protein
MSLYSTLDYCKSVMAAAQAGATQLTIDNAKLLRNLRTVSRRLDNLMGAKRPLFVPIYETRRIRVTDTRVNSFDGTFDLGMPLLTLVSVSLGDAALTVNTDVEVYPDADQTPYFTLRIMSTDRNWYNMRSGACSTEPLYVSVTGFWGLVTDYTNAWQKVDDVAVDISASATSLTVADIDGTDAYGLTPRISAGNLLKIGDEILEVLATNTSTNVATVRRGANGTTAAAHTTGDDVYVFMVDDAIRHVTARQAGLMYHRFGAYTTVEISGLGSEVRYPADLLQELRAVLQEYQYAY